MKSTISLALLLCALALNATQLAAQGAAAPGLLEKYFPSRAEKAIGESWFSNLPAYMAGQIKQNRFPQINMTDPKDASKIVKIEIDDIHQSGTKFHYFVLVRDGADTTGKPIYKRGAQPGAEKEKYWMEFSKLEAKHLVHYYPVKANPKDEDIVSFAVWIYQFKDKDSRRAGNWVLTTFWNMKADVKPLVEAFIIEKEGLKAKPGELEVFNEWDVQLQVERDILVAKDAKEALVKEREASAQKEFTAIVDVRGNYNAKQKPPRKPQPKQQLVWLDWRIKEFRRIYGSSEVAKKKANDDKLVEIQDSIKDDLELIKDIKKQAKEEKELKKSAQIVEIAYSLDPEDLALCGDVATAWTSYANIKSHGNEADHVDGAKAAIPYIEKILKAYPENTSYLMLIGKCYQCQEDGKAKVYYKKIIEIAGKDSSMGKTAQALMDNQDKKDQNRPKK